MTAGTYRGKYINLMLRREGDEKSGEDPILILIDE